MHGNFKLIHLPDYDPICLSKFEQLYAIFKKKVELYLPNDLKMLFESKFAKKINNQAVLSQLRRSQISLYLE